MGVIYLFVTLVLIYGLFKISEAAHIPVVVLALGLLAMWVFRRGAKL